MSEHEVHDAGENMEAAAPEVGNVSEAQIEETQSREDTVPLSALQSERAQRQRLQEELALIKDHLTLSQANQQRPQQQNEMDSLSDDDVLTVGEAKKFISQLDKNYKMTLDELKMTQKHPDYQEVITKYLPDVLKQNPSLKSSLQQTQDYELAYYLAKHSDAYKQEHKKAKKSADAERLVQNAQRAGSLSSVGQNSPVSEVKRWKEMSDKEFREQMNKNLGYY